MTIRISQDAPQEPAPSQVAQSPCERTRAVLEAASFPEGVDYEALILAEAEEEIDGW